MGEEEGGRVGRVAEGYVAVRVYDVVVVEDVIGRYEIFEWMWGHWVTVLYQSILSILGVGDW